MKIILLVAHIDSFGLEGFLETEEKNIQTLSVLLSSVNEAQEAKKTIEKLIKEKQEKICFLKT